MIEQVEPWLRGTRSEVDAVRRQVLHALEQAGEDVERWCGGLSDAEMNLRPHGLPPAAFQLRHMARSLDRLLSYADGRQLTPEQLALLASEMLEDARAMEVMTEFRRGLDDAMRGVEELDPGTYEQARGVGRKGLPTTVGGLMIHLAEHTQRHVGQAITTVKVVVGMRVGK